MIRWPLCSTLDQEIALEAVKEVLVKRLWVHGTGALGGRVLARGGLAGGVGVAEDARDRERGRRERGQLGGPEVDGPQSTLARLEGAAGLGGEALGGAARERPRSRLGAHERKLRARRGLVACGCGGGGERGSREPARAAIRDGMDRGAASVASCSSHRRGAPAGRPAPRSPARGPRDDSGVGAGLRLRAARGVSRRCGGGGLRLGGAGGVSRRCGGGGLRLGAARGASCRCGGGGLRLGAARDVSWRRAAAGVCGSAVRATLPAGCASPRFAAAPRVRRLRRWSRRHRSAVERRLRRGPRRRGSPARPPARRLPPAPSPDRPATRRLARRSRARRSAATALAWRSRRARRVRRRPVGRRARSSSPPPPRRRSRVRALGN